MDFIEVLDRVLALLQTHGRLSYRAFKRQFNLDDSYLEDLKATILYTYPQVVDDDGHGLVWTGNLPPISVAMSTAPDTHLHPPQVVPPGTTLPQALGSETPGLGGLRFYGALQLVTLLLQRDERITYRALMQIFGFDEALLQVLREELVFRGVARDVQGMGLARTGGAPSRGVADSVRHGTPASVEATPLPDDVRSSKRPDEIPVTGDDVSAASPPTVPSATPEDVLPDTAPARSAPEAERRQLTVMSCDLVGSTNLSGHLDPEDLREVVRAYQETAADVIQHYEGHIAQYLGDGLLVYFGYPRAHEDDAQRAVHAGLGIVEAMGVLNTRLEADYGVQLAVRLGIHTGPVVVGEMGGGERHEQLALGEAPNIAARLEGLAVPNTVVISSVTARLVSRTFALKALGRHVLKGVGESMAVSHVLGLLEMDRDATDGPTVGFDDLVGRDAEIGLLLRRWEQSKEGLGQVVLLSGEAGIGKSCLVEGLRTHVRQEGYTLIAARCSPYTQNSALYPVIDHLRRVLDWQPEDTPEVKLTKLEQILQGYSLPLDETVPLMAALLSLALPRGRYPAPLLAPQQQKQQTLDALVAWLLEEATRHPTLVVWEDLHWADPSTLDMLGLLLEQVPTVAILMVLVFRPEFVAPWPMQPHMTPIILNRLERPQVEAMVTRLAGGKTLPAEVLQYTVAKTDGVPLYVEELTKMLLESELLHEQADHYTVTGPLSGVAIPATLQDSLMARLDRLPRVREVAQLGAVIGREFAYEMIRALAVMDEATLQDGLGQLVEADLLYQRGRVPRATYVFRHALIRDAAYGSLLRRTRQQYHQQVAELLETRFPEVVETQPELVAYHYTEAGCHEPAIAYGQWAGQRAIRRSAHAEAISHLTKGLELLSTLPETPDRTQQELTLQLALSVPLTTIKGYAAPEVAATYARARELCRQLGDPPYISRVLMGQFRFHLQRAEYATARELAEQSLTLAQRSDDATNLLGAHTALGMTLLYQGEFAAARAHLEQGNALYDRRQIRPRDALQDTGISCLSYLAWVLWMLGYPDQSKQLCHEMLILAQEGRHAYSLAFGLTFAAALYTTLHEVEQVDTHAEAAMQLATERGFSLWVATGECMRGWARTLQGHGEEGPEQFSRGLTAYWATEAEVGRSYWITLQLEVYSQVGQAEKGLRLLVEELKEVDRRGERFYEAELHRLKGVLLLAQSADSAVGAETCFRNALDIARRQQAKSWELRVAIDLSRLWYQQGKHEEARQLLLASYSWFTEGFNTPDLQKAKALLKEFEG